MPRATPAPHRFPWIPVATIALVAGLIGAGASRQPAGRTIVGFASSGKDGATLLRLWSDGTMEQSLALPASLDGRIETARWEPVAGVAWPSLDEQMQRAFRLMGAGPAPAR